MPPDAVSALIDIREAGLNAIRVVRADSGLSEDGLAALMYYLVVVGEAVKRLPLEFRAEHTAIRWTQIAGLRDMLVHRYDRIDSVQIRRIATDDLPSLLEYIAPLIPDEPA